MASGRVSRIRAAKHGRSPFIQAVRAAVERVEGREDPLLGELREAFAEPVSDVGSPACLRPAEPSAEDGGSEDGAR